MRAKGRRRDQDFRAYVSKEREGRAREERERKREEEREEVREGTSVCCDLEEERGERGEEIEEIDRE
jgi:hypothetical protein